MSTTATVLAMALAISSTHLGAQKMAAPGDSTRVVQMHDMQKLIRVETPGQTPSAERADREERMQRLVSFAKTFVKPPLAAEEDISSLSGRYLVALARPEQQAWIAELLARNIEQGVHQILLEIQQFRVPAKVFAEIVPPLLKEQGVEPQAEAAGAYRYQALLDDAAVARILLATKNAKGVELLRAPSLLLNPMTNATVEAGTKISYIKDYAVQTIGDKISYYPIHATLLDGVRIDASCGLIAKDLLGVSFEYLERKVEQPIPEFETTIGVNNKVKVQLPASTLLHLEQRLELPDGGTALLAITNPKGPQLMFLVRVELLK